MVKSSNSFLQGGFIKIRPQGIRTSGELRLSNFLPWQAAYSELYFTDTLWPDFDEAALQEAIAAFNHRNRRFGGV